jgi:transposase-like protein
MHLAWGTPLDGSAPSAQVDPLDKPHIPEKCKAGLMVANADKPLAQYTENPERILAQLRGGKSVKTLASEFGISATAFYAWLVRNCPDEFLAISAGRSLSRIEQAEEDLDTAEDQLAVSKARESARLAQWNLERASKKLYGDSKQEQSGITVQVLIARDGSTSPNVVIDHE